MGIALLFAAGDSVGLGQADVSGWPEVRIELLALDAQANPIPGLAPDTLVLNEDGQGRPIAGIKPDTEAQSICLLIDSSGSMVQRLENVRSAATRLLRSLPPEDEVCIADFSWKLYIDQGLTQDRPLDIAAVQGLKASGGTRLRDSLMGLSDYMRGAAKHSSRAIVLLSDGSDNASLSNEQEMKRRMEMGGGAVVHVICVPADGGEKQAGSDSWSDGGSNDDQRSALRIANMFGGLTYFPRNRQDTEAAVDHLIQAMQTRYLLTYQTRDPAADGHERPISVGFDKAHSNEKAVLRAPEGYYAPLQ